MRLLGPAALTARQIASRAPSGQSFGSIGENAIDPHGENSPGGANRLVVSGHVENRFGIEEAD